MHRRPHLTVPAPVLAPLVLAPLVLAGLAGCSRSGEPVAAAPRAGDAACARALAAAPAQVLGRARAPLDVAGTLAWGEPAIVLRCGLPALAPTSKPCLDVNGVDWVVDDAGDPILLTTYGRDPAVEVRVPRSAGPETGPAAASALTAVAAALPRTDRRCIGA